MYATHLKLANWVFEQTTDINVLDCYNYIINLRVHKVNKDQRLFYNNQFCMIELTNIN